MMGLGLLCMAVTGVAMRRPCFSFFHCLKAILGDERTTVKVEVMGGNEKKTTQRQIDTRTK